MVANKGAGSGARGICIPARGSESVFLRLSPRGGEVGWFDVFSERRDFLEGLVDGVWRLGRGFAGEEISGGSVIGKEWDGLEWGFNREFVVFLLFLFCFLRCL